MPDIVIDFASPANTYRRLYGGGNGQPIAKAVGLKTYGLPLTIIDATAGFGQDSFVLACLGCKVTMIERSPEVAAILADALSRGLENETIKQIIANMNLITGNSIEILKSIAPENYPDVIYLDPMFPERTKTALVKKEMRILKELVGEDLDAGELLAIACKIAKRRVVVKRPRAAGFLGDVKPHSSQVGKANRFDIYMPN
jgi:16S rRNA (guanine1516-N2)-methyltransferase